MPEIGIADEGTVDSGRQTYAPGGDGEIDGMGDTSTRYCGIGEGGEYGIGLGLGLGVKGDRRCQGGILLLSSASSSASLWITAAVTAVRNADIGG